MKKLYTGFCLFFSLLVGTASFQPLHAQGEIRNWFFGNQAGLFFGNNASPVPLTNGALTSYEGSATISTAAGELLMYSNGEQVWDKSHQLMPNGTNLGAHTSSSQAVLILPHPGNSSQYFIFTTDAIENNLVEGLRYSIVDMTLRGGLGDVTSTKAVRLPTPTLTGKVTEKLTAALHANGRDYWIVVHGWESNQFYSFLLSPTGISTTPVVSSIGPVHAGGGSFFGAANAVGYMRISPDGSRLALAQRDSRFELYNYDNSTGAVTNYVQLERTSGVHYGIAFSSDNSRLYCSLLSDDRSYTDLIQYNLLAGSPDDILSSRKIVATVNEHAVALQLGPDKKIYVSALDRPYLHVIESPNSLGVACDFRSRALLLDGKSAQSGLPNFPNAFSSRVLATAPSILNEQISVYPNPAGPQAWLRLPEAVSKGIVEVAVFNAVGQKVLHRTLLPARSASDESLPLAGMKKGLYTVQINGSFGTVSKHLCVE